MTHASGLARILFTVVLLAGIASWQARSRATPATFPLVISPAVGAEAHCKMSQIDQDGSGREIQRQDLAGVIQVAAARLTFSAKLPSGDLMTIVYPRKSDGSFSRSVHLDLSGPNIPKMQPAARAQLQRIARSFPLFEVRLAHRPLDRGDSLYADGLSDMLDSIISGIRPDAVRRSFSDTVRVEDVRPIGGRPAVIAGGGLRASYVTRGAWVSLSTEGSYAFDVATGLSRSHKGVIEVALEGKVARRSEQETYCTIIDPPGAPLRAAPPRSRAQEIETPQKERRVDAPADIRARLETVDSLLQDGLITEDEAAAKRAEILKGL